MKPREGLVVRDVEGETVILDRSANHLHTLNPTASFIWHQLDGSKTVQDIAHEMSQAFDIDIGVAEKDVATVIDGLRGLQLLHNEDADDGTS